MQETGVRFLGQGDPLEKEMETHSSILAWEIPWTEEPGGLQSMGLQKSQTGLSGKEQQLLIYSVVLVLSVHQNKSFKKNFFN